jgi:hypothetical protein
LSVVIQLGLLLGVRPVRGGRHWDLQQAVEDAWAGFLAVGLFSSFCTSLTSNWW